MHARSRLVHHVDGLVGKVPVGNIAVAQTHGRDDRLVGVPHAVMLFVFVLDILQDLDRLIDGSRVHHDLLEPAVERAVFFDVLTVFVQRCSADALEFSARESRLEHIRRIERTGCPARTDDRVKLVDEQDDVFRFFELVHHCFHPLFELAAVLCAGDERGKVERHDALAVENAADFLLDDPHRKSFGDRGLSDARLPDEDRVVLLPAAQDLRHAFDFFFAADDGVEFAFDASFVRSWPKLSRTGVFDFSGFFSAAG